MKFLHLAAVDRDMSLQPNPFRMFARDVLRLLNRYIVTRALLVMRVFVQLEVVFLGLVNGLRALEYDGAHDVTSAYVVVTADRHRQLETWGF